MKYTKNMKLSKPSYDDDVDVQILNNNVDILDNAFADKIKAILGTASWENSPEITLHRTKELLGEGAIVSSMMGEVGYIKFYNGIVIQWAPIRDVPVGMTINLPTPVSQIYTITGNDENQFKDPVILTFNDFTTTGFKVYGRRFSNENSSLWGRYICIGRV